MHSQAAIPSRVYESYDLRYNHSFEVSATGDGIITVQKPPTDDFSNASKPMDVRMEPEVIERLLNAYFTDVSWMLPVITKEEFLSLSPTPPILLYSMCLVAAAKRDVSQSIFDSLRYTVNTIIKAEDILSTPSLVNVQATLILCMLADCHSQFVPSALSALWIRLGAAIRMVSHFFVLPSTPSDSRQGAGPWSTPRRVCQAEHRDAKAYLGCLRNQRSMVRIPFHGRSERVLIPTAFVSG